ncbi:MAG TPA: ATP cone domain-containing protein [Gemmataceae bacterium]|nr:ATP cone domain-containing protein [Gemmataceae bacterium]
MEQGDLPELVRLADGRIEPFEPERITHSLFAAAESLGKPDAFLARELTEGVLHFLAAETSGNEITGSDISWVVVKVVRELGHPDLARVFDELRHRRPKTQSVEPAEKAQGEPTWVRADQSPALVLRRAAAESLVRLSRIKVFSRELVAAHDEDLIRLAGLEHPLELAGVCSPVTPGAVLVDIERAREIAGSYLAIDGPEYELAAQPGEPTELVERYVSEARFAANALGLSLILNLNIGTPPPRLAETSGPLFAITPPADVERRHLMAYELAAHAGDEGMAVWWHMTASELASGASPAIVDAALVGRKIEFVFDRPRSPIALGPGIDRVVPAALIQIGINLARLAEVMGGAPVAPEVYLQKVASLTRFAKTAAHAKHDFLRRHGRTAVRSGFMLERARVVFETIGLVEAARAGGREAADFARDIVKAIRLAGETDRPRTMAIRVDGSSDSESLAVAEPGLTMTQQIKLASPLHSAIGGGRLDLQLLTGAEGNSDLAMDVLRAAAESHVGRLRLTRF